MHIQIYTLTSCRQKTPKYLSPTQNPSLNLRSVYPTFSSDICCWMSHRNLTRNSPSCISQRCHMRPRKPGWPIPGSLLPLGPCSMFPIFPNHFPSNSLSCLQTGKPYFGSVSSHGQHYSPHAVAGLPLWARLLAVHLATGLLPPV